MTNRPMSAKLDYGSVPEATVRVAVNKGWQDTSVIDVLNIAFRDPAFRAAIVRQEIESRDRQWRVAIDQAMADAGDNGLGGYEDQRDDELVITTAFPEQIAALLPATTPEEGNVND